MQLFDPDPSGPRELLPHDGSATLRSSYLDASAAEATMAALLAEVALSERAIRVAGRWVTQPRLDAWIGDADAVYSYSGVTVDPQQWTPTTAALSRQIGRLCGVRFNSVLVNLYRDGDDAMGFHADDEPELGAAPTIASLSLGGTRRLRFRHRSDGTSIGVDLDGGSLLVMAGRCQQCWMHAVPRTRRHVSPRLNLTFRRIVPTRA